MLGPTFGLPPSPASEGSAGRQDRDPGRTQTYGANKLKMKDIRCVAEGTLTDLVVSVDPRTAPWGRKRIEAVRVRSRSPRIVTIHKRCADPYPDANFIVISFHEIAECYVLLPRYGRLGSAARDHAYNDFTDG
jgi:hypothetical protein